MAPVNTRTLFTCGHVEYVRETSSTTVKFWKKMKRWIPNPFKQPSTINADCLCFRCSEDQTRHEGNHPFVATTANPRIKRRAPPARGTSQTLVAIALAEDETSIQALKSAQEHNLHLADMRLLGQVPQMTVAQQIASKEAERDLERSCQFWNDLHESHKHLVDFASNKSYGPFAELHLCRLCLESRRALVDPMYREKTLLRDHIIIPDPFLDIPQDDSNSTSSSGAETAGTQVASEETACRPVGDDFIAEIGATMVPQADSYEGTQKDEEYDAAKQEFAEIAARMTAARRGQVQQLQDYPEEIRSGYAALPTSSPGPIPTTFDEIFGVEETEFSVHLRGGGLGSFFWRKFSGGESDSDSDTESPVRIVPFTATMRGGKAAHIPSPLSPTELRRKRHLCKLRHIAPPAQAPSSSLFWQAPTPVAATNRDMQAHDDFTARARTTHHGNHSRVNQANASPCTPANQQPSTRPLNTDLSAPNPNREVGSLAVGRIRNFLCPSMTATPAGIFNIPLLHPTDPRFVDYLRSVSVPHPPPTNTPPRLRAGHRRRSHHPARAQPPPPSRLAGHSRTGCAALSGPPEPCVRPRPAEARTASENLTTRRRRAHDSGSSTPRSRWRSAERMHIAA